MVVLSPSVLPVPTLHCFRHEPGSTGNGMLSHKNSNYIRRFHENITVCCSFASKPTSQNVIWRRDLLLFALSSSLSAHFPSSGCLASEDIGPPNIQFLKSKDKETWAAKDVADSVLSDKSALRVTSSQRMSESSVLDAHASKIDGELYWYYEYLVRKSPTKSAQEANLYRHYVASTAEREGYLYSLNASTLSKEWTEMGTFLERTVASFRLLPPTDNYVPPYKDPWRFW
ncbi:PsbP domain-containing protein 5 [Hibiscus syriacus]|uniref:PsbP domain-containing protein 5 n=1 Tax=Hibiscus syriacus TaxID=106335 RepID=A0A6A3ASP7_HIBSY|nr:PsbP domain-containing protein 5 [Hibiscus syriacus]